MKRLFLPLFLIGCLLTPLAARAQTTPPANFGKMVGMYTDIAPSKVLADPTRNRVYVLEPANNDLLIFDTNNLPNTRADATVVKLPVGSIPVDMALSLNNSLLYIANSGSTVDAVSIVNHLDAATPTLAGNISLGGPGLGIAAALDTSGTATNGDDILIVLTTETIITPDPTNPTTKPPTVTTITPALIVDVQVNSDGTFTGMMTGQVGYAAGEDIVTHKFVGASPDGTTVLLAGSLGLESFNVSDGSRIAADPDLGTNAIQLVTSYDDKYLCVPDPAGNGSGSPLTTILFDNSSFGANSSTGNVGYYGTFSDPATPGPLAFNGGPLDANGNDTNPATVVYQLRFDSTTGPEIIVFNTTTFLTEYVPPSVSIPTNNISLSATGRNTITLDNTDSLLFVGASTSSASNSPGQLLILSTGTGSINPFQPPVISTTSLPDGAVGVGYTPTQISATQFPTSFDAQGLPRGISVDPTTGIISGTTYTAGTFPITLTATNQYGTSDPVVVNLTITGVTIPPPTITSPLTASVFVDSPFTYQITATSNPTSFDANGLPDGLTVDTTTGIISGTPTTTGTYDVALSATNVAGTGTNTLELSVVPIPIPGITSPQTATDQILSPFTYQITATNNPTSFGATGLPAGLTLNTVTGVISGAPLVAGTFTISLSATNLGGTGTGTLTLLVTTPPRPVITSVTSATVQIDVPFSYQITATNSPTSFGATGLPAGLTVDTTTGVISGTPTAEGTFSISLRATNLGGTGSSVLTLTVTAIPTPAITSPGTSTGTVEQTFSYQITASNMVTSFTASGLPSGLSVNTTTGLISGTPLVAGTFTVTLTATNVSATGTSTLTLTIAPNVPTIALMATVSQVTAGTNDRAAITFSRTGDLTQPLIVAYSVKGSAHNGVDYYTVSGRAKIKANRASATVQIIPKGSGSGNTVKVVKLIVQPAITYQTGATTKVKVKILPGAE